ncbi:MAG: UDP-glucose:undecaprenyl-phosphate glucose-1-phosphate transferase [Accumulibacter sp.]|uniref:undecaprenyl-phosphate glucose phosphotransferase n=1 Tax=Accumulibacter sp. TaxID=2053492 RepID=UPI0011FDC4BC|nr:undecaprenyl-phosphate glucose phosphotransferase [Accumulibacter sp.]TLD43980.1 MAG: UDP-glucose:undecaprenyl-phosphate glucose-1-phosphate transferase [Accumulibacter sp.]
MASKGPFFGVNRVGGPIVQLTESLVDPVAQLVSLFGLMVWYGEDQYNYYIILGILLFSLSFPGKSLIQRTLRGTFLDVLLSWAGVVTLLLFFGWATGLYRLFPSQVIVGLLWMTPLLQLAGHLLLRLILPALVAGSHPKRSVIVGCNELGRHLAAEIDRHPLLGIRMLGYFDDRNAERLDVDAQLIKGDFADVAEFARRNAIEIIYLAVPMASQPRIVSLLDSLADTTASVYFVPDVFVTELVQARMDAVGRVPVLAVCDTPFAGLNGMIKRATDIVLSLLILTLIAPLLLLVATMVRLDSPGAVIFKQRRYGLDGKEIIVYKFRSMSVCEDGPLVAQACRGDPRVTRTGAVLRKTSLDELPQFFNVLQGRMSIVGPRPHAVAHNETYRKLIKGYMVRHKVKPGITGWAQVNGYRGETQTLDKMEGRVAFDLEYLRNWSLKLDLYIIFRTVALVFKDAGAY